MVYFTINFTSTSAAHPWESLRKTLVIWLGFIMFAKQSMFTTGIISALLVSAYYLENNIQYYRERQSLDKSKKDGDINAKILSELQVTEERMINIQKYIFLGTILTLFVGFAMYLNGKQKEYGDKFDWLTFMFGVPQCDGLK